MVGVPVAPPRKPRLNGPLPTRLTEPFGATGDPDAFVISNSDRSDSSSRNGRSRL
jgi:hypothetical protein